LTNALTPPPNTEARPVPTLPSRDDLIREVDKVLGEAIERTRHMSQQDEKLTPLMLMSLALIGLCIVDEKPIKVDVLGFDIRTENWYLLGFILSCVVLYMLVNALSAWWSGYKSWRLIGTPRLVNARDILSEMLTKNKLDLSAPLMALQINQTRLLPNQIQYEHPQFSIDPPEKVADWVNKIIGEERDKMRYLGFFKTYATDHWEKEMAIAAKAEVDYAKEMHGNFWNDECRARGDEIKRKREEALKALGNGPLTIGNAEEFHAVAAYVRRALGDVNSLLGMVRLRVLLNLIVPYVLATSAMMVFSYQAGKVMTMWQVVVVILGIPSLVAVAHCWLSEAGALCRFWRRRSVPAVQKHLQRWASYWLSRI
jgi:hypothetical protein